MSEDLFHVWSENRVENIEIMDVVIFPIPDLLLIWSCYFSFLLLLRGGFKALGVDIRPSSLYANTEPVFSTFLYLTDLDSK